MLANLITTILLAIGVATGNVSSNYYKSGNAFNNEITEKPKQQAVDYDINIQILNFTQITEIGAPEQTYWVRKLYLGNQVNNANYYNDYVNIRNTIYITSSIMSFDTQKRWTQVYILAEITPMIQTRLNNMTLKYLFGGGVGVSERIGSYIKTYTTDNALNPYIDMTATATTPETLYNEVFEGSLTKNDEYFSNYVPIITNNGIVQNFTLEKTIAVIEPDQPIYVVLSTIYISENRVAYAIMPNEFTFTARAVLPEINYEVVDIPNLMFTILTLPFAWFSTAFNLTVFPNTPYALNFGNLVLTIIAAMTLLYLLRKILH